MNRHGINRDPMLTETKVVNNNNNYYYYNYYYYYYYYYKSKSLNITISLHKIEVITLGFIMYCTVV
jgi:hypothetical protein